MTKDLGQQELNKKYKKMKNSKKWVWFLIIIGLIFFFFPKQWLKIPSLFVSDKYNENVDTTLVSIQSEETESVINLEEQQKLLLKSKDSLITILKDSIKNLNYEIYDLKFSETVNVSPKPEVKDNSLTEHIKNNTKFVDTENTNKDEKVYVLPKSEYMELTKFLTNRYSNADTTGNNE